MKSRSTGQIGSLVELLQGKLSKAIMEQVTDRHEGLFPKPKEIKMRCSCPDYAGMCKHVAAAMYGIGNRLDSSPELLFVLRGVDHLELIAQAIPAAPVGAKGRAPAIANDDLGALFDIEIGEAPVAEAVARTTTPSKPKPAAKKATASKKAAVAKADTKSTKPSTVKTTAKKSSATKVDSKSPAKLVAKVAARQTPAPKMASVTKAEAKVTAKRWRKSPRSRLPPRRRPRPRKPASRSPRRRRRSGPSRPPPPSRRPRPRRRPGHRDRPTTPG